MDWYGGIINVASIIVTHPNAKKNANRLAYRGRVELSPCNQSYSTCNSFFRSVAAEAKRQVDMCRIIPGYPQLHTVSTPQLTPLLIYSSS